MDAVHDGAAGLFEEALRAAHAAPAPTRAGGITARDLVVVLVVSARGGAEWSAGGLARELGLSAYETGLALERARRVGLMDAEKRRVQTQPLLEFLIHGLNFVFPAEIGRARRGIATAQLAGEFVWPSEDGDASGRALAPLDECALRADAEARGLLSLVDALRIGQAWERMLAVRGIRRVLDELS